MHRNLLFDLDQTLLDFHASEHRALKIVMEKNSLVFSEERYMLGAKNACLTSCWFMPQGNIEEAVKEYDIDYTASTFDELYEIINDWSAVSLRSRAAHSEV